VFPSICLHSVRLSRIQEYVLTFGRDFIRWLFNWIIVIDDQIIILILHLYKAITILECKSLKKYVKEKMNLSL
jgi:hypothetical protein